MAPGKLRLLSDAHRLCTSIFATLTLLALLQSQPVAGASERLVRASDLRGISVDKLSEMSPVRLRGVVNWSIDNSVFVQDETGGTYFRLGKNMVRPRVGDEVEVAGDLVFGIYVPGISATSLRILGHGPPPEAFPITYDGLASGEHHYQRVSIEGYLRAVLTVRGRNILRLSVGSHTLDAEIWFPPEPLEAMFDRLVKIEGLAAGTVPTNNRVRISRPFLRLHSSSEITLLQTEASDPPPPFLRGKEVLTYEPAGRAGKSIRVGGTVTGVFPNNMVYLRDDGAAFGLRLARNTTVEVGDDLEAIGYPEMESFNTRIVDARITRRTPGTAPAPVTARLQNYLRGIYANELVSLQATVADVFRSGDVLNIIVRGAAGTTRVLLPDITPPAVGSVIIITGVCVVESAYGTSFEEQPVSMSLMVRSAADLTILSTPPWWNARRLTTLLLSLSVFAVVAGIWIVALRRQVARQTTALRTNIESEAALRERARIAREFHDTLAQNLTGLQLRLDAIASEKIEEPMGDLLTDSRHLVTRLQAETKNLVTDLRETESTHADLPTTLAELSRQNEIPGGRPTVRTETIGPTPSLSPFIVYQLRMIAQESLTNALKHGAANEIVIGLASTADLLTLTVADDGCGFDISKLERADHGHFGCAGIRERCARIGAKAAWHAAPGRGTVVEINVPLQPLNS